MSEDEEKVKLRRLEPAIQKFTKIVIPTDLERLRKHQINIEKVRFISTAEAGTCMDSCLLSMISAEQRT